jgi:hypothetical protein
MPEGSHYYGQVKYSGADSDLPDCAKWQKRHSGTVGERKNIAIAEQRGYYIDIADPVPERAVVPHPLTFLSPGRLWMPIQKPICL